MDRSEVFMDLLGHASDHEEAAAEKEEEYSDAHENTEAYERVVQVVLLIGWYGRRHDLATMRHVQALAHEFLCAAAERADGSQRRGACHGSRRFFSFFLFSLYELIHQSYAHDAPLLLLPDTQDSLSLHISLCLSLRSSTIDVNVLSRERGWNLSTHCMKSDVDLPSPAPLQHTCATLQKRSWSDPLPVAAMPP